MTSSSSHPRVSADRFLSARTFFRNTPEVNGAREHSHSVREYRGFRGRLAIRSGRTGGGRTLEPTLTQVKDHIPARPCSEGGHTSRSWLRFLFLRPRLSVVV